MKWQRKKLKPICGSLVNSMTPKLNMMRKAVMLRKLSPLFIQTYFSQSELSELLHGSIKSDTESFVSVIAASVWQLFSLSDLGPSWSEVGTTDRNGGNYLIAVIQRGQKFKETMEAFQQKRAEFIAQGIRSFDAETLYVFLEWIRGNGHKLDRITGMAV